MKKNMGRLDKSIRIVIALTIGVLFWQNMIYGALAYTLLTVAAVFLLTSLISFCPLYALFKMNTCEVK